MRLGEVELVEHRGEGRWLVRLEGAPAGEAPLPPYIVEPPRRPRALPDGVRGRGRLRGGARPPASTSPQELLARLDVERITLHVGLDTFRPVSAGDLDEHEIHSERYRVEEGAWERIRRAERVVAVGTTTVRVLESLARGAPLEGRTSLFVTPGFEFERVDALVTNFHLPRSTLLALVMAFAGVEETRRLYRIAIDGAVPLLLLRRRDAALVTGRARVAGPGHPIPPPAFERTVEKRARGHGACRIRTEAPE